MVTALVIIAFCFGFQSGAVALWTAKNYLEKREAQKQSQKDAADMDAAVELVKDKLDADIIPYVS